MKGQLLPGSFSFMLLFLREARHCGVRTLKEVYREVHVRRNS